MRNQAALGRNGAIKDQLLAGMGGHLPSCLGDERGAGGEVPVRLFGQHEGGVPVACGDEREAQEGRVGLRPGEMHLRPGLTPARMAQHAFIGDQAAAGLLPARGDADGRAITAGTCAAPRLKELTEGGGVDDTGHGLPLLYDGKPHAPVGPAVHVSPRAVDRVDDPAAGPLPG